MEKSKIKQGPSEIMNPGSRIWAWLLWLLACLLGMLMTSLPVLVLPPLLAIPHSWLVRPLPGYTIINSLHNNKPLLTVINRRVVNWWSTMNSDSKLMVRQQMYDLRYWWSTINNQLTILLSHYRRLLTTKGYFWPLLTITAAIVGRLIVDHSG